jgi:hypothetical protein
LICEFAEETISAGGVDEADAGSDYAGLDETVSGGQVFVWQALECISEGEAELLGLVESQRHRIGDAVDFFSEPVGRLMRYAVVVWGQATARLVSRG